MAHGMFMCMHRDSVSCVDVYVHEHVFLDMLRHRLCCVCPCVCSTPPRHDLHTYTDTDTDTNTDTDTDTVINTDSNMGTIHSRGYTQDERIHH